MTVQPVLDLQPAADVIAASAAVLKGPIDVYTPHPLIVYDHPLRRALRDQSTEALASLDLTISTAVRMQQQLNEIVCALSLRRHNVLSKLLPIYAMPNEILLEIFAYVVWDMDGAFSREFGVVPMYPRLTLTHVCAHWRALCRGHARLWSSLTISNATQSQMIAELGPLSKSLPLCLITVPQLPKEDVRNMFEIPESLLPRVFELRCSHPNHVFSFQLPRDSAFSGAQRIHIGTSMKKQRGASSRQPYYRTGNKPLFPAVRELTLMNTETWLDDFHDLEHLILTDVSQYQCASILGSISRTNPKLDHVEFSDFNSPFLSVMQEEILLPWDFSEKFTDITLRGSLPLQLYKEMNAEALTRLTSLTLDHVRFVDMKDKAFRPKYLHTLEYLEIIDDCFNALIVLEDLRHNDDDTPHLKEFRLRIDPSGGFLGLLPMLNQELVAFLDYNDGRDPGAYIFESMTVDRMVVEAGDNEEYFQDRVRVMKLFGESRLPLVDDTGDSDDDDDETDSCELGESDSDVELSDEGSEITPSELEALGTSVGRTAGDFFMW